MGATSSLYILAPPATVGKGDEPKPGRSRATDANPLAASSEAQAEKSWMERDQP